MFGEFGWQVQQSSLTFSCCKILWQPFHCTSGNDKHFGCSQDFWSYLTQKIGTG